MGKHNWREILTASLVYCLLLTSQTPDQWMGTRFGLVYQGYGEFRTSLRCSARKFYEERTVKTWTALISTEIWPNFNKFAYLEVKYTTDEKQQKWHDVRCVCLEKNKFISIFHIQPKFHCNGNNFLWDKSHSWMKHEGISIIWFCLLY